MKCPHCNQDHPDNFQFCPIKGLPISLKKACNNPNCTSYGEPILPTDACFCPECGQPLDNIGVLPSPLDHILTDDEILSKLLSIDGIVLGETRLNDIADAQKFQEFDVLFGIDIPGICSATEKCQYLAEKRNQTIFLYGGTCFKNTDSYDYWLNCGFDQYNVIDSIRTILVQLGFTCEIFGSTYRPTLFSYKNHGGDRYIVACFDNMCNYKYGLMNSDLKEAMYKEAMEFENSRTDEELDFCINGVIFYMKLIERGKFNMGSPRNEREVVLTKSFYMSESTVTQELWRAVMGKNPSFDLGDNKPVNNVSWYDCQTFVCELNKLTGLEFRLPTSAEWEFAAKGGKESLGCKFAGSNEIDDVGWYENNSNSELHDIKTLKPNELGLYDMSGNIQEWCQDWYYPIDDTMEFIDPIGSERYEYGKIVRGGYYADKRIKCQNWVRERMDENSRWSNVGFRLVLTKI